MNTYNFFFREYENGIAVDRFLTEQSSFPARDCCTWMMLSDYLEDGIIVSFGWSEVIPY